MEFYYIFIVISVLTSAICKAFIVISNDTTTEVPKSLSLIKRETPLDRSHHETNHVLMPLYSLYIIGFTMLLMLIAIIGLAIALYLALKNKSLFGFNVINKRYIRQESTGVTPLYNVNYDEQNKNNGSTLTVNSGIIEISEPRVSDPATPTRLEDSKIIFAKKPLRPIVPVMHKGQMDAICKEVLRKVQKTDSASFRDLNELFNFNEKSENRFGKKCDTVKESEKENKKEEKAELKIKSRQFKLNKKPEVKTETQNEIKKEIKNEIKEETRNETSNEMESKTKPVESKDVKVEVNNVASDKNTDDSTSETEYDTVPTPIRYRHSGPESENCELDDIPLYDLPPRRSFDGNPRNVIHLDQESQYLVPISAEKTESCYVNAKRNSFSP